MFRLQKSRYQYASGKVGFARVPEKGKDRLARPGMPGICARANWAAQDPEGYFFVSSKAQLAVLESLAPVCLSQNTKS